MLRRRVVLSGLLIGLAAVPASAQQRALTPYVHAGVGLGRFVFLCTGCGYNETSLVPSLSLGLSMRRIPFDVGLDLLNWSHLGDRYTILTAGTTFRPRGFPLFIGGGLGLAFRGYPAVCTLCTGPGSGTPTGPRSSSTDVAAMLQVGGRIRLDRRVGLEPFAQFSRLSQGSLSVGHADHLSVGIRLDGR